jgi:small subunit ribosomal protein S6
VKYGVRQKAIREKGVFFMLKNYELLYIVHPDLEGTTDKVSEKVSGFIGKIDGKILNQEDWGKRKLSYAIAHNDFGVYVLVEFQAESEKLNELERNLRLSEEVIRSMVVSLPEEKEAAKKAKSKKVQKVEETKDELKEEKKIEEEPKAAEAVEETIEKEVEEKVEKPKKTTKKTETKTEKTEEKSKKEDASTSSAQDEEDRLKKLDEKLEEILGEDKK